MSSLVATAHTLLGSTAFFWENANSPLEGELVHPEYKYFQADWELIRDVIAGERRIKEKSTQYLPMLDDQTREEYRGYLNRAIFYNATDRTLQGLLGSLFRKDPVFTSLPDNLARLPAITLNNEDLTSLCRQVATEVLTTGRCGILLDRSEDPVQTSSGSRSGFSGSNSPDSIGTPTNLPLGPNGSVQVQNAPYFAVYTAEQILNWSTRKINGRYILDSILLYESDYQPDPLNPLETKLGARLRLLFLDGAGEFAHAIGPVDAKGLSDFQTIGYPTRRGQPLRFIPFMFFNPTSLRASVEKAPLLEIAQLNLSHYQNYAALQHGRFYTAMPTWYIKGEGATADTTSSFKVGPNTVWKLEKDDDVGLVEYKGSGLQYLENSLEMIEKQMQSLGARLVNQTRRTAAQASISYEQLQAGERASLLSITQNLNIGMTFLTQWWMWWEEYPESEIANAQVEFNQAFREQSLTARDIRAMQSLWTEHAIPITVLYSVFRSTDIIPGEMSLDEYKALLQDPSELPPPLEPQSGNPNAR